MDDRVIILIPAKGASVRVPNKNMRTLGDQTLVGHAVSRSVGCNLGDVVVSTESQTIKYHIANKYADVGVNVLKRPLELALRDTRVTAVITHALTTFKGMYDTLIMTLPSTPFITGADMVQAYDQFIENNRTPLFCITKVERAKTLLMMRDEKTKELDTWGATSIIDAIGGQYGDAYLDNGGVYIFDVKEILDEPEYYKLDTKQGYIVPLDRGFDIDTEIDFMTAQVLLKWRTENGRVS